MQSVSQEKIRETEAFHVETTRAMRQMLNGPEGTRGQYGEHSKQYIMRQADRAKIIFSNLVYTRLFLYYQHKIRKYQQTWRSPKSRKRLRKVVEAGESMALRRRGIRSKTTIIQCR